MTRNEAKYDAEQTWRPKGDYIQPLAPLTYVDDLPLAPLEEAVDHPAYYGGADNVYEAIRVIEAWGLDFCLGNAVKYISRAGKKGGPNKEREDLRKALWYVQRRLEQLEGE